ncbi:MAG: 16S rRNA (cytosine(967)-C(5))-methyltransferase RsmB [Burkholderiales bacterium]
MVIVQRHAAQILSAVLSGASLTTQLEALWLRNSSLLPAERGAIQDICYGTLRNLGRLNGVMDQLVPRPVSQPQVRSLLLAALYQLEYTAAAPYAIVDHAVDCAMLLGGKSFKSFANAVLRSFQRQRVALLAKTDATESGQFSFPPWWIRLLRKEIPESADRVMKVAGQRPPMTLRVNGRCNTVDEYLARLNHHGMSGTRILHGAILLAQPVAVDRLPGFGDGLVSVQDAGAQWAAHLLDVKAGMKVLDACAAPGGKTAHVCELQNVNMTALDNDSVRLLRVQSNMERLGLHARIVQADAADLRTWWDGISFDRVLLDAPCSASGAVRRHPDIKWIRKQSDIEKFSRQQKHLLEALWKVVARGGKLLYVTCSIFREENQHQIDGFLARHPDAQLLGNMPGTEGLVLPDDENDGFFYSLLQKN